jgi:hypothetical protein
MANVKVFADRRAKNYMPSIFRYRGIEKFSNFDMNIGNFHCIIFKALQFYFSTLLHTQKYMSDHHNMCHVHDDRK